jgi:hypothetical protein
MFSLTPNSTATPIRRELKQKPNYIIHVKYY